MERLPLGSRGLKYLDQGSEAGGVDVPDFVEIHRQALAERGLQRL
jgi:hypothetical protein